MPDTHHNNLHKYNLQLIMFYIPKVHESVISKAAHHSW